MNLIEWNSIKVETKSIKPTPINYKIKTAIGKERLTNSLKLFGLASNIVVNTDMVIIDGNSRLEQAKERGEKKVWVSMPNRNLTPEEFKEMSAMYDFAKEGEVDIERIQNDQGTREDFFRSWKLEVPEHLLAKLGKGADKPSNSKSNNVADDEDAPSVQDFMLVNLCFTEAEEKAFRIIEAKLAKKFKTEDTTQTVLKALKSIK